MAPFIMIPIMSRRNNTSLSIVIATAFLIAWNAGQFQWSLRLIARQDLLTRWLALESGAEGRSESALLRAKQNTALTTCLAGQ